MEKCEAYLEAGDDHRMLARNAARGLRDLQAAEDQLLQPGPQINSDDITSKLIEILALDPFLIELYGYHVEDDDDGNHGNHSVSTGQDAKKTKENKTHAKQLSPEETATIQLWVRILEKFTEDGEADTGCWIASKMKSCLQKFLKRQQVDLDESSSSGPELARQLQRTIGVMLHIQTTTRALVSEYVANGNLFHFDQKAYAHAGHCLLLRTLALESSLSKVGPCVLRDFTMHSLVGMASWNRHTQS